MRNENITYGNNLDVHQFFPMVDGLNGPEVTEKIIIYPGLVVYKNMLPGFKKHTDLLKKSYRPHKNNYYFNNWDDWYGFGDMMNLPLDPLVEKKFLENDEYLNEQIHFINEIRNAFYKCTKDYIDQWNFKMPNWIINGISICKYKETPHHNKYAMYYHTDFRRSEADSPGKKFGLTCTIYINDDYKNGGLSFFHEETGDVIDYKPSAGDVVVFPSGEPYWHAVERVDQGEKYFVRLFWSYFTKGTKDWILNEVKYGKNTWEKMESDRMKKEMNAGMHHKYLIEENENKTVPGAQTFKAKRRIRIQ